MMIRSRPRIAPILLVLAGLLAAYISLTALHMIGVAHADTPAAVAGSGSSIPAVTAPIVRGEVLDPIAVAQGGTEAAWGSIESYGPLWGGALLLFGAVGAFLRRNAATHWLAQGKTLAALTTGTMLLAAVLTWKFHGGDTAGLLMSVFLAIKMLVSPTVTSAPETGTATPARNPQSGKSALLVLLAVPLATALAWSLAVFAPACHYDTVKADVGALAHGTVTCAKADVPAVRALGLQLATEALVSAVSGHGIPWAQLEAEAEAGAKAQGIAIGSCAFGQMIADLSKMLPAPAPGVMARTDDGRGEIELLKAHLGVTAIRTADGQVL